MQKKSILQSKRKQFFKMASLMALVKRKSRQSFLQTPGKTNYNNVTAFFVYFISLKCCWGGKGLVNKNGLG